MVSASRLLVTLLIGSTISLNAFAKGPAGSGGGNGVQNMFRGKSEEIVRSLVNMSEVGRSKLRFDPSKLLRNLLTDGRVRPECATGENLKFLTDNEKMAYVGAPGVRSEVILLDCRPVLDSRWNTYFNSKDEKTYLFFLHELLRNDHIESEKEDDGSVSSSYSVARIAEGNYITQEILPLVISGNSVRSDCALTIWDTYYKNSYFDGTGGIVFKDHNKDPVAKYQIPNTTDTKTDIQMKALEPNSEIGNWIYQTAKRFHCKLASELAREQEELRRRNRSGGLIAN